jgi:A/G-specific adenine glycosylase
MSKELNAWFQENKRPFPWRENPTPYRVWVSEIMLQQTRAQVVVGYFERWMALFPDIATLANASLEQVIKTWEGLGYYSRARNLHRGAQYVLQEHGGELPSDREALLKIPGIGPYTVGAILSFGFRKRAAAVDGNVLRVISRYMYLDEEINRPSARKKITEFVERFLSEQEPWVTSEALIELGATICTQTPRCTLCPLNKNCLALQRGGETSLPLKAAPPKVTKIIRGVAVIESEGYLLIRKNPEGQIMEGLSEWPYFEGKQSPLAVQKELKSLGLQTTFVRPMKTVTHTFTRYVATLFPYFFTAAFRREVDGYQWIPRSNIQQLPFSSGHRKILGDLT